MSIYLVRHGRDDEGYRGGWSQRGLNAEGYRQSERLGIYLKENKQLYNIHRIVSSDLSRALDTAGEIAAKLGLSVERDSDWREANNGAVAGMPNEIADKRYPGLYFAGLRMDERYAGGESPLEFYTRIKNTFERWRREQEEQLHRENVLVVTHGGVINVVYHLVRELEWTNLSKEFPSSYTSVHKIEHSSGKWEIELAHQERNT
ncbi:histidine phosphatase family protein [Paenibacillus pedocola]|uniref:histidine phosphatase family protein n=1 Tax=Paenibacillus pedocola TaxID=3242193 RepID=UPI002877458B|nr:histidine phosphatase family protein [Paenibacillus typhae]